MRAAKWGAILRVDFLNNGYWKLLSLVIAVLIYFSIRADISHVRVISIPVETEFDAEDGGVAIESVEPRSVQVTLRGSYADVNQLTLSVARCVLRPRQKKSLLLDTISLKIRSSNLRGVRGVRVVKIEPNEAVVKFDVPMMLTLPVARPVEVGMARGRVQLLYDQTNAVVRGSRRQLSQMDKDKAQIQPESIDVSGRSQNFVTRVKLLPPGEAINAVVDPPEMVVNVQIISEKATARIERVPVVISQPFGTPDRWRPDPAAVDIEVSGRGEIVNGLTLDQVTATVNGNYLLTPSVTNEVPVVIHVQQGVEVSEAKSLPVTVKLVPLAPLVQPQVFAPQEP